MHGAMARTVTVPKTSQGTQWISMEISPQGLARNGGPTKDQGDSLSGVFLRVSSLQCKIFQEDLMLVSKVQLWNSGWLEKRE